MITHYLKVAFRNLVKYKTQSIISIVGLAVGFTCFALATLWIRYEMTYDSFHEDADRIYILSRTAIFLDVEKQNTVFSIPLASDLKQDFPEIESVGTTNEHHIYFNAKDGSTKSILDLKVDSCFLKMFKIPLLAGSMNFLYNSDQIALTEEEAANLFGTENPLGKEARWDPKSTPKTVVALVKGWGEHTNLPFGVLSMRDKKHDNERTHSSVQIWIKLKKDVDVKSFQEKLYKYESKHHQSGDPISQFEITPISECRYKLFPERISVQFNYLVFFSITGGLVILSALFNYLSLFASRLRMRMRELALRKVCGSSNRRLYILLSMEFVLVLVFACLLGMAIIELVLPTFQEFTKVTGTVYGESLLYFVGLMLVAMLSFLTVVYYFNKKTLRQTMKGTADKVGEQFFYRSSIVLQMTIGILFLFSIAVIFKQINHLRNGDIGMERKNIAVFYFLESDTIPLITEKLKQIPAITQVVNGCYALFPQYYTMGSHIDSWDGKQPTDETVMVEAVIKGEEMTRFYKFRLLKGELLSDSMDNTNKVLINETGAKRFGWKDPIGKKLRENTVIGMIKDFHKSSPTTPIQPALVVSETNKHWGVDSKTILIKYSNQPWKTVQSSIDSMMAQDFPGSTYRVLNVEEEYEYFLKSENTLLKLLSIVAVVCILISVFGIYSFITLTCERRRKEMAIRKVNGAKVKDILFIFLKEYAILLAVSALIAFTLGYALMKRWLESYVEQTRISWWIYVVIFAGIAGVVLFSIGSRVWKAARQNPAEVIKSE